MIGYYYLYRLGSFDTVNYKTLPNYEQLVSLETGGKGADVILDPVLASFFKNNMECLAMDSRWVMYGAMGGVRIKEASLKHFKDKRASILTSTLRNRTDEYKTQLIKDMVAYTKTGFESGELKPIIHSILNLSNAKEAMEIL